MDAHTKHRETVSARSSHTKQPTLNRSKSLSCKRGERYSDKSIEAAEQTKQRLRVQEKSSNYRQKSQQKIPSQPLRRSARQRIPNESKPNQRSLQKQTSSTLKVPKTNISIGQQPSPVQTPLPQAKKFSLDCCAALDHAKGDLQENNRNSQLQGRETTASQDHLVPGLNGDKLRLTSKNLARVAREIGSQKLSSATDTIYETWDFIEMAKTRERDSQSKKSVIGLEKTYETSASANTVSTTHTQFQRLAKENGILEKTSSTEASNMNEIRATLKRSRDSPPPEVRDFKRFCRKVRVAQNGSGIQRAVLPLLKEYDDEVYESVTNQQFTKFPRHVGFNDGLSAAKPDFVEGYLAEAFDPYPFRDRLGGSAISTTGEYPIALPHLTGEFKKYGGDFKCGTCQAAYDAATLVYGRKKAGVSMGKIDQANAAYIGSFVCDGDRLLISVHYSAKNTFDRVVYHQCPVFDRSVQTDYESFVLGRQQLRNLQDWAKKNACVTKDSLIVHYKGLETLAKNSNVSKKPVEENRKVIITRCGQAQRTAFLDRESKG